MAYDVKRMYSQARGFQLAGERCVEVREHPEQQWLPIQAIVCFSFACEIYLKAIYQYENPDSDRLKIHNLDDLFGMISDEHKDYIRNELSKDYRTEDIEKYIKQSSKVFEDYRYVYESDSDEREHVGFVYSFSVALERLVGKLIWKTVHLMAGIEWDKDSDLLWESLPRET